MSCSNCQLCENSLGTDAQGQKASTMRANGQSLTLCCCCEDALFVTLNRRRGVKVKMHDYSELVYARCENTIKQLVGLRSLVCTLFDELKNQGCDVKYYKKEMKKLRL